MTQAVKMGLGDTQAFLTGCYYGLCTTGPIMAVKMACVSQA